MKEFLAKTFERIKTTLPGVLRNYPVSSGAIFIAGLIVDRLIVIF